MFATGALLLVLAISGPDGAREDPLASVGGCAVGGSLNELSECYSERLSEAMATTDDPNSLLPKIESLAFRDKGYLNGNCHTVMHTAGRKYGEEHDVTVSNLMSFLPRNNDPGCSAGFAHGLLTHVAPTINPKKPREAAAVCDRPQTRFQRYSCVHGFGHVFMRIYTEVLPPALRLCQKLGPTRAPDCAQGAYHDYWFSLVGLDDTRRPDNAEENPRKLCAQQPRTFVIPCWYRAFIDTRPYGYQTKSPRDFARICKGLDGLHRRGCITASSVIGVPDPFQQFKVCARLPESDIAPCLHGVKVQNLGSLSTPDQVKLIRGCDRFDFGEATRGACYRWFGKALAVLTNGDFGRLGCRRLKDPGAAPACVEGARQINDALVTFS
jgi:hypothetical protein